MVFQFSEYIRWHPQWMEPLVCRWPSQTQKQWEEWWPQIHHTLHPSLIVNHMPHMPLNTQASTDLSGYLLVSLLVCFQTCVSYHEARNIQIIWDCNPRLQTYLLTNVNFDHICLQFILNFKVKCLKQQVLTTQGSKPGSKDPCVRTQ